MSYPYQPWLQKFELKITMCLNEFACSSTILCRKIHLSILCAYFRYLSIQFYRVAVKWKKITKKIMPIYRTRLIIPHHVFVTYIRVVSMLIFGKVRFSKECPAGLDSPAVARNNRWCGKLDHVQFILFYSYFIILWLLTKLIGIDLWPNVIYKAVESFWFLKLFEKRFFSDVYYFG